MQTNGRNLLVLALTICSGVSAHAGEDYQNLKKCLQGCYNTTDPLTWARAHCVGDCYADYADSKFSVNPAFDPSFDGTEGLESFGDIQILNLEGLGTHVTLEFHMPDAPALIESVTFRAFEGGGDPEGIVLAIVEGPGESFIAPDVETSRFGRDGMLMGEVKYVGIADIDDVGAVYYSSRHVSPPSCYADCDQSGGLDIFDFLCFQNAFATGAAYADCDGSGELDIFDFLCFQDAFAAGCP